MIDRFIAHIKSERRYSELTVRNYSRDITAFVEWFNSRIAVDSFDATKPLKMGKHKITDYRVPAKWLTVGETLIHSSNIASAQMALKVGKEETLP